jgi:Predicted membrane protein
MTITVVRKADLTPRQTAAWLLLIVLVGSLLRFIGLDIQSLWNDELSSVYRSSYSTAAEVINQGVLTEFHPPGYHLLLFVVEQLWDDSETAVRMPSAIFGVLSIIVIFWIGARFYSRRVGLIAAMLMAVLEFPVYYSQEARCYAALLLFSMASMGCWMEIRQRIVKQERVSWPWMIGYQLSSLASAYFHYFGLLLLAIQAMFILWEVLRRRCSIGTLLIIYVPIGILYAPWLPFKMKQTSAGTAWISMPSLGYPFEFLRFLFNRYGGLVIIFTIVYLLPFGLGLIGEGKLKNLDDSQKSSTSSDRVLLWWLFLPLGIVLLLSWLYKPMAIHRYLIICLPAAYFLAARSIERLPINLTVKDLVSILIGLVLVFDLIIIKQYYTKPHKEQFREAVEIVVGQEKQYPNSLIVACSFNKGYFDYYFRHQNSSKRVDFVMCSKEEIQRIKELVGSEPERYVWLMRGNRKIEEGFLEQLMSGFELIQHSSLIGADVWLLRSK